MIKKAVLLTLSAPFLMVFSVNVYSIDYFGPYSSSIEYSREKVQEKYDKQVLDDTDRYYYITGRRDANMQSSTQKVAIISFGRTEIISDIPYEYRHAVVKAGVAITEYPVMRDEECQAAFGGDKTYYTSSDNFTKAGGACSVSPSEGVAFCYGIDADAKCKGDWIAVSTGQVGIYGSSNTEITETEFELPVYLTSLEDSTCTDNANCVTIGTTSYLVNWDIAPDHFSYVDANGVTHTNTGTIGGDDGGGDPTDPGGDNGGGSGDGSTVPDFEFDDSSVIEAIRSSGQSNRNSINSLSNDVTGAISQQTEDFITISNNASENLNLQIDRQTTDLTTATTNQTDALTDSLDDQTTDVTDAIGDQTGSLTSKLGDLQTAIVDGMKNITVRVSGGGGGSSGGSDGEGDGEGDGEEEGFLDTLIDKLASLFDAKFEEAATSSELPSDGDTAGMIDGEGVTDEIIQSLDQEAEQENTAIYDEFEGIFEGGGIIDGALSPLRDFVTSFLPSLPTGGCTPLVFGAGERSFTIDCEGFNLLKAALSWVLFFFTAYQLISIPMDARKAQQ